MEKLILIVDGIELARRFIKQSLEKNFSDVLVEEACDLSDAQKRLSEKAFDAVICDSGIQPSGGKELLKWVRSKPTCEKTCFIMLIPAKDSIDIKTLVQHGANAGIAKPFTVTELIESITSHLSVLNRRSYKHWGTNGFLRIHRTQRDVEGQLIDLSLGGVLTLTRRDSGISILDQLQFDLCLQGISEFENVKGLVIRIQAVAPHPESQYVKCALKFIDMPHNVEARLLEYLRKMHPYEW